MQQENLIGTTMGQYQILDELGRGGMAIVYKAWQPSLRRYVALKVLLPYLGNDPEFIQRFQQEGIVAANLSHPHIVTIYEVGQHEGHIFIAMEYVEGTSLEQLVLDQGALPLERVVGILRQVAEALDYAHKRRFLHRDIKPANILLAEDDRVVITDFGIAKALEGSGATARLTSTGTVLGTPAYMSPEQIQGLAVDHRSDLYAFGIVAYEMLSGQVPFDGTTTALLYAQVNNPPPGITRFAPGLPPHVEWTIARMLAKQPSERFVSAGEFVEALTNSGTVAAAPAYEATAVPRFSTPPPQSGTAVMPSGAALPQPSPGLPPHPYGYPATQAASGLPGVSQPPYGGQPAAPSQGYGYPQPGYPQSASGWVEPTPAKKKRAVWPWLVGGGLVLVILAVVAVLGYFFLGRMAVARLVEEGETALAAQDYTAAQVAFEAALEKDADNAAAYRGLGWAQFELQRHQEAIQSFSKSLELAETDDGYLGLCKALSSLGDQKGVVALTQRWIIFNSQNADAYVFWGWGAYTLKNYAEAVEAFSLSLELKETGEAHHGLGDSLYAQKEYGSALTSYQKWASLEPESALAYASVGWAQYSMKSNEDAARSFSKALEIEPIASAFRGLGSVYYAQDEYELALENQQQWVNLEPNSAAAHGSMGWTLQKLQRPADAAGSFQRAVELFPTTDYYSGLWTSLRAIPDYQKALSAAQQWAEFDADKARPFAALGWTYVDMNNCASARSNFQKALELDPQSQSAKSGLDRCP